jgi:hypothetical protein
LSAGFKPSGDILTSHIRLETVLLLILSIATFLDGV